MSGPEPTDGLTFIKGAKKALLTTGSTQYVYSPTLGGYVMLGAKPGEEPIMVEMLSWSGPVWGNLDKGKQ